MSPNLEHVPKMSIKLPPPSSPPPPARPPPPRRHPDAVCNKKGLCLTEAFNDDDLLTMVCTFDNKPVAETIKWKITAPGLSLSSCHAHCDETRTDSWVHNETHAALDFHWGSGPNYHLGNNQIKVVCKSGVNQVETQVIRGSASSSTPVTHSSPLLRSDGRCGSSFPLPDGTPGQCDPLCLQRPQRPLLLTLGLLRVL